MGVSNAPEIEREQYASCPWLIALTRGGVVVVVGKGGGGGGKRVLEQKICVSNAPEIEREQASSVSRP